MSFPPMSEEQRIAALRDLNVLDSHREREFDALVEAAAIVCGAPISLLSLIDDDRQWIKASVGLPGVDETPRCISFCSHTIQGDDVLEVPDAWLDERFAQNPLVHGRPKIRFYAGAPLRLTSGARVGALCIIGQKPGRLSAEQRRALQCLADAASKALESRRATELQRQTALALVRNETRLRLISESTSDVIMQISADLEMLFVSPSCATVFGLHHERLIGRSITDLVHGDDRDLLVEIISRLFAGGLDGGQAMATFRVAHAAGHWLWIEAGFQFRFIESDVAPSLACSLRDVTRRHRANLELLDAKKTAENAARMQSEFLANMSHELRTPLTGILRIHDLLQNDPTMGPTQKRYLDLARGAGHSLLLILNDVLDYSKIDAGHLTIEAAPFDLRDFIATCCDFSEAAAKNKDLRLSFHVGDDVVLTGDPTRLRQVLSNLISNAIKFTRTGGVHVEAQHCPESGRLRIEVADTGVGVPEAHRHRLFKRFSQVDGSSKRSYGGTGLGLAICKRLIELMGGEIGFTSQAGHGSTFWFEAPLAIAERAMEPLVIAAPSSANAAPSIAIAARRKILLAEDNAINREVIGEMLRRRGYDVTVVVDGLEAVASACGAIAYDIILMDMQMPMMDGLTASRVIRQKEAKERRRVTPIVALTANAMSDDIARCYEAGMDAHIAKPLNWALLFAAIDDLVAQHSGPKPIASGGDAVTVLNTEKMAELEAVLGADRVAAFLSNFADQVETLLPQLAPLSRAQRAEKTHSILALSGQFGFTELWTACSDLQKTARHGEADDAESFLAIARRAVSVARDMRSQREQNRAVRVA